MTPYEVLGVAEDADDATIRTAYQKAIRAAHPDRGGDADRAAAVNDAYAMLSDPVKRLKYDNGRDTSDNFELQAWQNAQAILAAVLDDPAAFKTNAGIVQQATARINDVLANINRARQAAVQRQSQLQQARARVTSKTKPNLVHDHIDRQVAKIDASFGVMDQDELIGKRALEIVQGHQDVLPEERDQWKPLFYPATRTSSW